MYLIRRMTYIYIIFEKGGNSFNYIETYNKFKAKFLPGNRHKTSNEIAQRKLGQSINNILLKIFCKTFAELQKYFVGQCRVRNPI